MVTVVLALEKAPADETVSGYAQNVLLCLIETMPMGDITGDRTEQYLPLSVVRARLRKTWTLEDTDYKTGGPARYYTVKETGRRIGFITPMTHNFCESCNRVRLTCTGTLYMCLGQEIRRIFARCCAPACRTMTWSTLSARQFPASRKDTTSSLIAGTTSLRWLGI